MGFCCECRAPKRLRYVPPIIIFGIIIWLYTTFVRHAQPLIFAKGGSKVEIGLFHVLVFLLFASLIQCLLSKGSFLNCEIKTDPKKQAVELKFNGERRFCRKCKASKPDRTHHCSSCNRCVLKMDHHCVYINKCIGYYNYKYFVLFLGWSSMACLFQSYLVFQYLLQEFLDQAIALHFFGKLEINSTSLQIVLVFFFSACLGAALFCFYLLHIAFTAKNYTTLEYCEKRRDAYYENFYDIGIIGNFQQVFGTWNEFLLWFLPVPSPSTLKRRGRCFPLNSKFDKKEY